MDYEDDVLEYPSRTRRKLTETKKIGRIGMKERIATNKNQERIAGRRKGTEPLNGPYMRVKYEKYIRSERWYMRARQYYRQYGKQCAVCNTDDQITLHHMSYAHMGNERDNELVALCKTHHSEYHERNGTQSNMVRRTKAFIKKKRNTALVGEGDAAGKLPRPPLG